MKPTPLRQSKSISDLTRNLEVIMREIQIPFLYGRLIENIALEVGKTASINPKLDKVVTGWIVVRQNANANIWDLGATTNTLNLNTNQNVIISIWVF